MSDWLIASFILLAIVGTGMASRHAKESELRSEIESIKKECAK